MASAPRRAEAPARLSGPHSTLCPARPAFRPSLASPRRAARTGSRTRQPGRRCGARTTAPHAARARRAGSSGTRPSTGPDLSSARCHPRPPLPRAVARPSPPRAGRRGSGSRGGRGRARTSAAPSCRPGTQTRAPLAAPPPGPVQFPRRASGRRGRPARLPSGATRCKTHSARTPGSPALRPSARLLTGRTRVNGARTWLGRPSAGASARPRRCARARRQCRAGSGRGRAATG